MRLSGLFGLGIEYEVSLACLENISKVSIFKRLK